MKSFGLFFILLLSISISAQSYSRQDSLRGSITPERAWWNLIHYDLSVEVQPEKKFIIGQNVITYTVLQENDLMQIDLQSPMKINKVLQNGKELSFISDGNAHFIKLKKKQITGKKYELSIYFSGHPQKAVHAPWEGGFSWKKDRNNNHFIATSNQGIGASIWWPNKDHGYDEPDEGLQLNITLPNNLVGVGNGRLIEKVDHGTTKTWRWEVIYPINNYGVNINIGDYVYFGETYEGEKGTLDMDYWVLRDNESKAKQQFKQAPKMMKAFEYWFGPYPFYEDSFKLVEVPYLGMEHQSSITYGNKFENGYLGHDLSGTGWGLKFDFIIIHESGHEWFANNITSIDIADMWIHEGFAAYSENLYLDYYFGSEAASAYVIGTRKAIQNDRPIIGNYNVNEEGSVDMYYKSATILHTLRQLIEDDALWRSILRGVNETFYHQTVTSDQIEKYISTQSGKDLTDYWNQYLRTIMIPLIVYKIDGNKVQFRYEEIVDNFDMPVIAIVNGSEHWIFPTADWKTVEFQEGISSFFIKRDFFVDAQQID